MSNTFRTKPIKYISERASSDIIIKRSRLPKFQVYPVDEGFLKNFLSSIDKEYIYKLNSIELIPMNGKIARRFGSYLPSEKRIVLYGLFPILVFRKLDDKLRKSVLKFNGEIEYKDKLYWVNWCNKAGLSLWYAYYVLCHEIAHHYVYINRTRRVKDADKDLNERQVDNVAEKIYENAFVKLEG